MPKTKTTFEKGHPYYPKKGAPFNKRELQEFLSQVWPDMVDAFWSLSSRDKWTVFLKLMEYDLPKLSAVQFEDSTQKNSTIEFLRSLYGSPKSSNIKYIGQCTGMKS